MVKEQTLVIQQQPAQQYDAAWSPEQAALLARVSLGLVIGMADFEKLLSTELRNNQRSFLLKPATRCCRYLLELFPMLGVDVSMYPKAEKVGCEMASRPMQMFLLRRDIATFATFVTASLHGDEQERAALLRKQQTVRLDLAYTALGIWGQLRRLLKRYRLDMDDVLCQIAKEQEHVDSAQATPG